MSAKTLSGTCHHTHSCLRLWVPLCALYIYLSVCLSRSDVWQRQTHFLSRTFLTDEAKWTLTSKFFHIVLHWIYFELLKTSLPLQSAFLGVCAKLKVLGALDGLHALSLWNRAHWEMCWNIPSYAHGKSTKSGKKKNYVRMSLHLVHSNLRTIFLVVFAYRDSPGSVKQRSHRDRNVAFLWKTGFVWPPKPALAKLISSQSTSQRNIQRLGHYHQLLIWLSHVAPACFLSYRRLPWALREALPVLYWDTWLATSKDFPGLFCSMLELRKLGRGCGDIVSAYIWAVIAIASSIWFVFSRLLLEM